MKYTTALPIRSIINARSGEWYYSKIFTKVPNMLGIEYAHVELWTCLAFFTRPQGTVISLWRLTKLYDGHRRALRGRILLCVTLALKQKMHFAKNVIHTITHFLF